MIVTAKTRLCIVIGDPVAHSLGPQMYTAAYRKLHIDNLYRYVARRIRPGELADFIAEVRDSEIRGVSCTIPHKVAVMPYLDVIDPVAKKIGAVNTIVNDGGVLKGYNTDWLGAVTALEGLTDLAGKTIALLGAGGVARAIAYGLTTKGARLTVYNRTIDRAQDIARKFGADAGLLEDPASLAAIKDMDIIINATSLGLRANEDKTPLAIDFITNHHVVFDVVYSPYETRLLRDAKQQGARIIHGMEMLLQQGAAQFKLYTGYDAPEDVMRSVLRRALGVNGGDDAA